MNPDPSRRSQRRRPDLSVNTSRVRSNSSSKNAFPPLSPPRRNAPVPSSRASSRGSKPPPALGTTVMASSIDTGGIGVGPSRSRATTSSHPHPAATADVETFLEMYTPDAVSAGGKENIHPSLTMADAPQPPLMRGQRDSHDLSLPSRHVRDSLVSNMLLSLDQFSMGQMAAPARSGPSFEDHRLYSLSTTTTDDNIARAPNVPTAPRGGGGGGGGRYGGGYNNYSSDYEVPDDASRVSGSISHSRRSNSSSGFQSSLGRINSMRESSMHRGSQPSTPRMMHSRGGKGSKSSSTNSIDNAGYVQVLGSQRWAHGFGGRSSSFDLGSRLPGTSSGNNPPPTSMVPQQQTTQPWHIEFSNSFFNDAYDDAAPTPTVPGGPRKLTSVPSMPSIPSYQPPPPDPPSGPERRRSVRSSRSATVGRQSQTKFNNATAPPLPAFDLDSAPAPNIGYEKSKEVVPPPTAQPQQLPQHPLRQKPSFFRRVFGGFRDTAAENEPVPQLPSASTNNPNGFASSSSVDAANGTRSQQHSSSGLNQNQKQQQSTPPSRDSHHSTHATLQKKPSGFFRRRKKSISETESPPPLPMPLVLPPQPKQQPPPPPPPQSSSLAQQQPGPARPVSPLKMPTARNERFVEKPSPSPVTSLSHAMSPYLKGSPAFANGDDAPQQQYANSSPLRPLPATDLDGSPHTPSKGADLDDADMASRTVRGFSPDYEPPPTATIRSVGPESTGKDQSASSQRHRLETPTRQPPAPPHPARSGSFLSDDSDGDDESPRRVMTKALAKKRSEQSDFLSVSPSAVDDQHLSPTSGHRPSSKKSGSRHTEDDAESRSSKLSLPLEGAASAASPKSVAGVSADSTAASSTASPLVGGSVHMPIVKIEGGDAKAGDKDPSNTIDEPEFVIGMPTKDDRQKALNIYEGSEDFIQKEKAAAWMGEEGPVRQRTLQAYMELYDFRNQSIVNALRNVCSRLVLRAETQQVDRILVSFSKRWCANNPNHSFKSLDIVHTICYSIMLLNTDLHLADIESKMTRPQFIKNTMTSIHHTLSEADPEAHGRSIYGGPDGGRRPSVDQDRNLAIASLPPRSESSLGHHQDDCGPLVKTPFEGSMRAWESQMEVVLKIIYNSIRDERLPLFGADSNGNSNNQTPNQSGLSVMGMLKRTPSVLSKAPSESQNSIRGRVTEASTRAGSSRWTSKSRSRVRGPATGGPGGAGGAAGGNGFSSSRTSFEDGNSIWSPTVSSATWSRQSLGRTQTSMSMESFGSNWGGRGGEYQQSIGFANALSQAIIREDALGTGAASIISDDQSMHQRGDNNPLLDDESLELAGPPWVKEGMVVHKHHLDGMDKKAKDRNWTEVFAVVQKGHMSLFSFTPNKSLRAKNRSRNNALPKGAVVGGGNWQENATNVGSFGLKQTLASALPPPGYSRQRPHVWALSLPTGAVHLFQVGTPEICKEFVTTANYWSARLSTHPLVGGISNIEYGWGEGIVNNSLVNAIKSESTTALPSTSGGAGAHGPYPPSASRPGSAAAGRASMQSRSSFRSGSFDFGHVRSGSSSSGFTSSAANNGGGGSSSGLGGRHGSGKLPGDRINIAEWMPPTQSLRPSNAAEPQQLQTLLAYVHSIEGDLKTHNALRSPMLLAFTPRGHNANKAMANWERKSSYLLREIVKYRTYVDCLTEAERRRGDIYLEREIARRAARGEGSIGSDDEGDDHEVDNDDNNETGAETARDDNGDDSDILASAPHRHRKDSDVLGNLGANEPLRA